MYTRNPNARTHTHTHTHTHETESVLKSSIINDHHRKLTVTGCIASHQVPAACWSYPVVMSLPVPVEHGLPTRCFPARTENSRVSPPRSTPPPTGGRTELHWNTHIHTQSLYQIIPNSRDKQNCLWDDKVRFKLKLRLPDEDTQSAQWSHQRGRSKHVGGKVTGLSCSHCRDGEQCWVNHVKMKTTCDCW